VTCGGWRQLPHVQLMDGTGAVASEIFWRHGWRGLGGVVDAVDTNADGRADLISEGQAGTAGEGLVRVGTSAADGTLEESGTVSAQGGSLF
jgi:hypothetical protein